MCFQLALRAVTLDDLELLLVRIFGEFRGVFADLGGNNS